MVYKRKDEIAKEEAEASKEENRKQRTEKSQGRAKSRANRRDYEEDEKEPPKFTSAYEEYRAGYWRRPKKEKVYITLETVIPPLPKNPLEYPDETSYHKQQAELDEKIDAINIKIKDLAERFNERL